MGQDLTAWYIKGRWWRREGPSWSQEWTEKTGQSRRLPGGRARETFELYAAGCVMEPLPINLSVKSSLLTDAFGEMGSFWGPCCVGSRAGTVLLVGLVLSADSSFDA